MIAALDLRAVYFRRMLERMNRLHWDSLDPLRQQTLTVLRAMADLRQRLEEFSTFQQAFLEEHRPEPGAVVTLLNDAPIIDPTRRPWEAGYRAAPQPPKG